MAIPNEDVLQGLKLKPPAAPPLLREAPSLEDGRLYIDMNCITKSISSFRRGSSGGIDGLRPIHLLFLTSHSSGEAGERFKKSISSLIHRLISVEISD